MTIFGAGRLKIRHEISAKLLALNSCEQFGASKSTEKTQRKNQTNNCKPAQQNSTANQRSKTTQQSQAVPTTKKLLAARGGQESSARCGRLKANSIASKLSRAFYHEKKGWGGGRLCAGLGGEICARRPRGWAERGEVGGAEVS
jgi:hypothetical protein